MTCSGCNNEKAVHLKSCFIENEQGQREYVEFCEKCGYTGNVWVPDVYFDGKPEENLADRPDGSPMVFSSKRDKAIYLKSKGIYEAGDTYHGAPMTALQRKTIDREKSRQMVHEVYQRVKNMSKSDRIQALRKIESQRERAFEVLK